MLRCAPLVPQEPPLRRTRRGRHSAARAGNRKRPRRRHVRREKRHSRAPGSCHGRKKRGRAAVRRISFASRRPRVARGSTVCACAAFVSRRMSPTACWPWCSAFRRWSDSWRTRRSRRRRLIGPLAALTALPIGVRRYWPLAVFVVTVAAWLAILLAGVDTFAPGVLVTTYTLAAHRERPVAFRAGVAALLLLAPASASSGAVAERRSRRSSRSGRRGSSATTCARGVLTASSRRKRSGSSVA